MLGKNAANHVPLSPLSFLARAAGIFPGRTAVVHGGLRRSWAETYARCRRLASALARAGVAPGQTVAVMGTNTPETFEAHFGVPMAGAVLNAINTRLDAETVAYILAHGEARVLLTDRELSRTVARALAALPQPPLVIDIDDPAAEGGELLGVMDYEGFLATGDPGAQWSLPADEWQAISLSYTSGTTGKPKGCRLANGYFLRAGEWYLGLGGLAEVRPDEERFITPLPLSHMNALAFSSMAAILSGGAIIQLDRFHPTTWWQSVRESGATIAHYLGVMPAMLLELPASDLDKQHHVRFGFGAGVDARHHGPFEQRFGFPLIEAWAMTETGAAACIIANREPRLVGSNCFGRPEAFVDTHVVDERGAEVGIDAPGELLVRAAGPDPRKDFFLGYLKDDAATEEAWQGGWFHTGDVVMRGPRGDFHFVDRKKNVIRRSGENISAVEVESVLNEHPAVAASAVAATPDPVRGDEVLACVVLRKVPGLPTQDRIAISIAKHALVRLAYYKAPGYIAFVDALPLTASQKIQRGELREIARSMPGKPNCWDLRELKRRRKKREP
jgi:acyl-CoA synthetase (AMP-forming)/AMP-acid ligase II